MILLGISLGLLIGVVASLWDKSDTQQPAPIWRRFALRMGYAGVCLLLALFSLRADWTTARKWTPVKIPFRFDKQNTVSASFTADTSATYNVEIDLKRNLPFEDINAFVGGWSDPNETKHPGPPRPEIVWKVSNVQQTDLSTSWADQYWGETVGLKIGEFQAVKGQRYTVTARIIKPSPTVQVLDPHLQIALTEDLMPQFYTGAEIALTGGVIAGVTGVLLLIRSLLRLQSERREI